MSFLYPAFLWALFALAIPVLIHLFQLRRFKRIDFPNVRFLAEVTQQTRARKKIQHWLVLLARMLALASLVLAFAQPYIPDPKSTVKAGQRVVSIFLDDSFSMDGQNAQGVLLDQARSGSQDAIMAFDATDRFQVITGRMEGRQQLLVGRDEALELSAQVAVGPYARPVSRILARQRQALSASEAPVKRAFLFTDLQRSTMDIGQWTNDSLVPTVIVPLAPSGTDNLSIDSAWFAGPLRRSGQNEALHVRIRNYGEQELVNVPLRLSLNGRQRALATFRVDGGGTVDTTLRFMSGAPGLYTGVISITDQPVVFDDHLHIAYRVTERLRVLLVSGGHTASDRAIAAVFSGDSLHEFRTQAAQAIDLASIERQDLIILNGLNEVPSGLARTLEEFTTGGGSIAVFPPAGGEPAGHADLFGLLGAAPPGRRDTASVKVERIDLEHPFYREVFQTMPRNVDLPLARERWSIRPPAGSDVLLRLQDGTPFLARIHHGRGSAFLCASPLDERSGNLIRHALFATSLLRMAESARPMGALYHELGAEALIPLEGIELNGEAAPHLKGPEGMDLIPEVRRQGGTLALVLHDEDLLDGSYALVNDQDTLSTIALNLPRRESDLAAYGAQELSELLASRGLNTFRVLEGDPRDLSLRLSELDQGWKLWKWFLILALLFLVTEVLLIRYMR